MLDQLMKRTLFGTDGVRGVAGTPPLTAEFAFRLGIALAERLPGNGGKHFLLGMDTRRSGQMLAHAMAAGIASRGGTVTSLGVIPTPGVAFLTRELQASAGIVISASHNPYADNGIKIFGPDGGKLSDATELELEAFLDNPPALPDVSHDAIGTSSRYRAQDGHYQKFLLANAPYLDGLKVGLDCANGAASDIAPQVFKQIGARLDVINAAPDGLNINVDSGSTHPRVMQERVPQQNLDVGILFDGDADRALMVDRRGRLVTGDHMLAILAVTRGDREVVATIMSNLGFEKYLNDQGITLHRTQVGDRYVTEELRSRRLTLGGEQSGHILMLDRAPTGDGLLTALQVLAALRSTGHSLEEFVDAVPVYPQVLKGVRVAPELKESVAGSAGVVAAIKAATDRLGSSGRVNVRPSGTEPLVRVMVEGPETDLVEELATRIVASVEQAAA